MSVFKKMINMEHEQIAYYYDKATGLKAIIGIHDTTLGPALGGCRIWPYKTEEEALFDVLRLSKGMTYKNATAGLNLGGGKAVIIANPKDKSEALMKAFGRFVDSLNGRYITAEDVNTSTQDMMYIRNETKWVAGLPMETGGSGDPSPYTALGTFSGIKASVKHRLGKENLSGIRIAIQGLGSVGIYLCSLLHKEGAKLIVSDIKKDRIDRAIKKFNAEPVALDDIYSVEADVFAPCALGAVVNDETINQFKFKVIAGAANNVLMDQDKHSQILANKKILYAPDYIINAGGVINIYYVDIKKQAHELIGEKVKSIYNTLLEIYRISDAENISTIQASSRFAEQRLENTSK